MLLDGWSLPMVLREVMSGYGALVERHELSLPPARPYVDYIEWLKRQDPRRAEEYWRRTLTGFTEPTPIGGEYVSGPTRAEYAGEVREIPESMSRALRTLAKDRQLTLNTLVQGAWALYLGASAARDDVVFGITVSGRPADLPGIDSMVGVFINTQPLRVKIQPEAKLLPWLETLQSEQAEAREFESSPPAQEWSEVPLGFLLFESLLVFENYPVDLATTDVVGGIEIRDVHAPVRTKYALTLVAIPGHRLQLYLSYDRRRFTRDAILEILNDLESVLTAMPTGPVVTLFALMEQVKRRSVRVSPNRGGSSLVVSECTPVEVVVARIWSQIMGTEPSSLHQSLFEMGGHSLLAARLASHVRLAFGIALPLRQVFEAPTIAGMALIIEAELAAGNHTPLPPIKPLPSRDDSPLSYSQEPIWLVHKLLPGTAFYNFSAMIRLEGNLNVTALDASFAEIKGALARSGWSGPIDRAPQQLRGWLGLRDRVVRSQDRQSVRYIAGNETFLFRF